MSHAAASLPLESGRVRSRRAMEMIFAGICLAPFVLLTARLCLYWVDPDFPLFAVTAAAWSAVVLGYVMLTPASGPLAVVFAAALFAWSLVTAALLAQSYMREYGAWHGFSDDFWYQEQGARWSAALKLEGWNLPRAFEIMFSDWQVEWSLVAWPVMLGTVGFFAGDNGAAIHAIAMLINAAAFSVLFAVFAAFAARLGRLRLETLFFCFLLVAIEMAYAAANNRKDMMLTLTVAASCLSAWQLVDNPRAGLSWWLIGGAGLLFLSGSRPVYLIVPAAQAYFLFWRGGRLGFKTKLAAGVLLAAASRRLGAMEILNIRGKNVFELRANMSLAVGESGGGGAFVYNLPLIGPFLYYLISPIPVSPMADIPQLGFRLFESAGTLLYVGCFVFVAWHAWKWRGLRPLLLPVLIPFTLLFASTVFIASEYRYKIPTCPFLGLMVAAVLMAARERRAARVAPGTGAP